MPNWPVSVNCKIIYYLTNSTKKEKRLLTILRNWAGLWLHHSFKDLLQLQQLQTKKFMILFCLLGVALAEPSGRLANQGKNLLIRYLIVKYLIRVFIYSDIAFFFRLSQRILLWYVTSTKNFPYQICDCKRCFNSYRLPINVLQHIKTHAP